MIKQCGWSERVVVTCDLLQSLLLGVSAVGMMRLPPLGEPLFTMQ